MSTVLGTRIKAARKALHPPITQREVAKRLGLTASAITLWEKGRTSPGPGDLVELARWFGVSTDWLLGLEVATRPAKNPIKPPVWTVPVVSPESLAKWRLDVVSEFLQTAISYPPGTAAAMLVSSDALTSQCPTGCYAVVSKGIAPTHGSVVLVTTGRSGEPVLRRYIREGRDELLIADDVRFPTYKMNDGARIVGSVSEVTIRKILKN